MAEDKVEGYFDEIDLEMPSLVGEKEDMACVQRPQAATRDKAKIVCDKVLPRRLRPPTSPPHTMENRTALSTSSSKLSPGSSEKPVDDSGKSQEKSPDPHLSFLRKFRNYSTKNLADLPPYLRAFNLSCCIILDVRIVQSTGEFETLKANLKEEGLQIRLSGMIASLQNPKDQMARSLRAALPYDQKPGTKQVIVLRKTNFREIFEFYKEK